VSVLIHHCDPTGGPGRHCVAARNNVLYPPVRLSLSCIRHSIARAAGTTKLTGNELPTGEMAGGTMTIHDANHQALPHALTSLGDFAEDQPWRATRVLIQVGAKGEVQPFETG
jgi:hypothetical protein